MTLYKLKTVRLARDNARSAYHQGVSNIIKARVLENIIRVLKILQAFQRQLTNSYFHNAELMKGEVSSMKLLVDQMEFQITAMGLTTDRAIEEISRSMII